MRPAYTGARFEPGKLVERRAPDPVTNVAAAA
jgi:hypothetical protein